MFILALILPNDIYGSEAKKGLEFSVKLGAQQGSMPARDFFSSESESVEDDSLNSFIQERLWVRVW
jgi:hypothetical protein